MIGTTTPRCIPQPPPDATHPEHDSEAEGGEGDDGNGDDSGKGSGDHPRAFVNEDTLGHVSRQPKRVEAQLGTRRQLPGSGEFTGTDVIRARIGSRFEDESAGLAPMTMSPGLSCGQA